VEIKGIRADLTIGNWELSPDADQGFSLGLIPLPVFPSFVYLLMREPTLALLEKISIRLRDNSNCC
jgi:hypothetical protein